MENRPLDLQVGWKVKKTKEWQYPDDWRITDSVELQLLDDFINLKIYIFIQDAKKESLFDKVFHKCLRSFQREIKAELSFLRVQNHRACNIKYRDLFRIFETLMNATCVEEKVAESFPITMVTNSFRAYLNEFRNSVSAKMKEKEEEKKRRKKPNKKSKRDKDVLEHQGHKFFQEQFGIPTFCDLCSNIMEKGHNCQKLPTEILRMDKRSVDLYKKALEEGNEKDYTIRIMVTGPYGVGKSTFTKRLLCQNVDINERESTDGIDVHVNKCKVSLKTSKWIVDKTDSKDKSTVERLAQVLKRTHENAAADKAFTDLETTIATSVNDQATHSAETQDLEAGLHNMQDLTASLPIKSTDAVDDTEESTDDDRLKHQELLMKDLKAVLQVGDKADDDDKADVSIWDFGGQFVFYTTHQMFLTHRAVYILVNNLSQHIDDIVIDDEAYFDCEGSKHLRIENFLDIWLNSIHGHSDRKREGTPPVILVGTHADKLNADTRDKDIDAVFDAIRNRFDDRDVSLHFTEKEFGLRNDVIDPKMDKLRDYILDVAKQQPYWGELKPAKWIPLERLLDKFRRNGVEIMSYSEVERLNESLPVPLGDDELELFLRLQHETGSVMYFGVSELKKNIVLSPQFLVNALKSLITAEEFCKKKAEIRDKWKEFSKQGVLRTSLIDAVWNTEENLKFQENRGHILALMEHLNIIARPELHADDDEETFDHDKTFYLVPCMLKESPPDSVLYPEKQFISTPSLCLGLENVAFPSAIFNRLLVGCISIKDWRLARSGKKHKIYCGYGQFEVDRGHHRLTLAFHHNSIISGDPREESYDKTKGPAVISLRITKFGQEHPNPDRQVCDGVHTTVKQILGRIRCCLSLTLTYEEFIQCPLSATASMMCMHPIEKLKKHDEIPCHEHAEVTILNSREMLKYWFDNNKPDGIAVPSVLNPATVSQVPTEKELVKISLGIGLKFQLLFLDLGISNARIEQIIGSYRLVEDQVVHLLLEWRKQRGRNATFRELETSMNSVGMNTMEAFKGIK